MRNSLVNFSQHIGIRRLDFSEGSIEFKVNNEEPLKQIKEKKYYEKYLSVNKEIYLIGIVFDEEEKNISKFKWEKV